MSPRTGRPTTEPKTHETRIRMSDVDVQMLEICCKETGMTKADVIRQGIKLVYEGLKRITPCPATGNLGQSVIRHQRNYHLVNLLYHSVIPLTREKKRFLS